MLTWWQELEALEASATDGTPNKRPQWQGILGGKTSFTMTMYLCVPDYAGPELFSNSEPQRLVPTSKGQEH